MPIMNAVIGDIYCFIGQKDMAGRPSKICGEVVSVDHDEGHKVVQLRALETGEDIAIVENNDPYETEHDELYSIAYVNPANWVPHRHFLVAQKIIAPVLANVPAPVRALLSLFLHVLFYFFLGFIWITTWAVANKMWGFGIWAAFLISLVPVAILGALWQLYSDFTATVRYVAVAIGE